MNDSKRKSFYISSKSIMLCNETNFHGFHLGFYSNNFNIDAERDSIIISLDTIRENEDAGDLTANFIKIDREAMTITGSDMNTQAVFYISIPERGIFVVFNDLLIAKEILQKFNMEVEYKFENDGLSCFKYVNRLQYGEKIIINHDEKELIIKKFQSPNILSEPPAQYSLDEAKEKFYKVLYDAVRELTEGKEDVCISLSGGVDSATVAYILTRLGKKVTAYTVGTDWGNEYDEAQETANFLGIDIRRIHLSKDFIIGEVPNVIRYFGFRNGVSIEIALIAFCLYKKLFMEECKDRTFVTGYGSDLLNAGIYKSFTEYEELFKDLYDGLRNTQYSNEFSNLAAINLCVENIHPFWHSNVIREAMKVPVKYKVVQGRDKYFFRSMMEGKLPDNIVWRTKLGAHQGSGLSESLRDALEEMYGRRLTYQQILGNIHKDIFFNNNYPWKKSSSQH